MINMESIELMSVAQLTAAYNAIAPIVNVKVIKKFETKAQAIKRFSEAQVVAEKLRKLAEPKATAPKVTTAKSATPKTPRRTITSVCQAMILDGKSNEEIWALIQPEFKLSDDKRYYPGWNRAALNRKAK